MSANDGSRSGGQGDGPGGVLTGLTPQGKKQGPLPETPSYSIFRRYDIVSQGDLKEVARKQEDFVSHFSHRRTTLEKAEEIIVEAQ